MPLISCRGQMSKSRQQKLGGGNVKKRRRAVLTVIADGKESAVDAYRKTKCV